MSRTATTLGLLILSSLTGLLGYTVWRMRLQPKICAVCLRPLHERSGAIALVEGQRLTLCCPACALTQQRQTRGAVKVVELTDYESDKPLQPGDAFIVVGSNHNHCVHDRTLTGSDKRTSTLDFDRCSPSMVAFARRQAAEDFIREHGGRLDRFARLSAATADQDQRISR
ncbi:MAG: nitrous oxide reductase accessory protein NosL [Bryobacteraceae bacterium]